MHPRSKFTTFNTTLNGSTASETLNAPDIATPFVKGTVYNKQYGMFAGVGNDIVSGGYSDDEIYGGSGNDTISGSYGFNDLLGGPGIDTVDYSTFGIGGTTRPSAGLNIALQEGARVGNGTTRDGGNFPWVDQLRGFENVKGSIYADTIYGNDEGNNKLSGLAGKDSIFGKLGNDEIYGGTSSDKLYGGGGDDELWGGDGSDVLDGGVGNDTFVGGKGRDIITPGGGENVFVYNRPSESTVATAGRDLIRFASGADKIDLEGLDANIGKAGEQDFTLIGTRLFSGSGSNGTAGELAVRYIDGQNGIKNTLIIGDINGDRASDFAIEIVGSRLLTLSDFDL